VAIRPVHPPAAVKLPPHPIPEPAMHVLTSAATPDPLSQHLDVRVDRRADGAIVGRVPSTGQFGQVLPDAVFAFRSGEPQYSKWARVADSGVERART
jgi:hypothetical protein